MAIDESLVEAGRKAAFRGMQWVSEIWAGYDRVGTTGGQKVVRDIAYGDHPRQTMDIYAPTQNPQPFSMVFLHGGSWQFGSKDEYAFVGRVFARAGIAVAIVNYQLYPNVRFPTFVDDIALALAWLQKQGLSYHFNAENILLMGHSAGAHIACLVAMDSQYSARHGFSLNAIKGVVGLSGIYTFRPEASAFFCNVFQARSESGFLGVKPVEFLAQGGVPLYLLHGRKDQTVACRSAERMYKNAMLVGHPVKLKVYESYGHTATLLDLLSFRKNHPQMMSDIIGFAKECLG